jgi:hypothetical protein
MDPILDESSLIPCHEWSPAQRIEILVKTLQALHRLGVPRVLRTVRDAVDREIENSLGLRYWVNQARPDVKRFLLSLLNKQPFIDGPGGLFAQVEGVSRILETRAFGAVNRSLGLAALQDNLPLSLIHVARAAGEEVSVEILDFSGAAEPEISIGSIYLYVQDKEVDSRQSIIRQLVNRSLRDGLSLIDRLSQVFPHIKLGPDAEEAFKNLNGNELVFPQLIRHLHALNSAAAVWSEGLTFKPEVVHSPESDQTLKHGRYGPMRDFSVPVGFQNQRWSWHTKFNATGHRMYFRPPSSNRSSESNSGVNLVLIGYFGPHLACIRHPN